MEDGGLPPQPATVLLASMPTDELMITASHTDACSKPAQQYYGLGVADNINGQERLLFAARRKLFQEAAELQHLERTPKTKDDVRVLLQSYVMMC